MPESRPRKRLRHPVSFTLLIIASWLLWAPGVGSVINEAAAQENTEPVDATVLFEAEGLPNEPLVVDTTLSGLSAHVWREGRVDRMVLDGWVRIRVGDFTFEAARAVIWICQRSNDAGHTENDIAIYLEEIAAASRPSGMSAESDELLVTATTIGRVRVESDRFAEYPPTRAALLGRANDRLRARYERATALARERDGVGIEPAPEGAAPGEGPIIHTRADEERAASGRRPYPARRPDAVVFFHADDDFLYRVDEEHEEGVITLRGNLVVQYTETRRRAGEQAPRQLTLTADRAVVFTDPVRLGDVEPGQLKAEAVRGAYLEGNVVASDGRYTMRGPRVYYDFATSRAIVLDAVLYTYDEDARVPIYMRAREIRQVSDNEWEAERVRLSTSEFFTPHISLGASRAALTRVEQRDGTTQMRADAENITLRAGDLPIFWWPGYEGPAEDFPMRRLSVGGNSQDGVTISAEFDLFGLIKKPREGEIDAGLILEYLTKRGPAVGLDMKYATDESRGRFYGYVIQDDGEDKLSSGVERDLDDETRGIISWSHMERLPNDWTMILETNYISDVNFLDSFLEDRAEAGRENQSRVYFKQQRENWALEAFARYDLIDFVPNEDWLQSRGYSVEKMPEIGYYRYADSLFEDRLSWNSEFRLSRMRTTFPRHTLGEIGQGFAGFGMSASTDLSAAAYASGYREKFVDRFHTRHEFTIPMQFGSLRVVPFAVGAFTAYDDEFEEYSSTAEDLRYYGAGGVRIHTQWARVDDTVENRLFDLHRLRHIVEPSVTLWHGESDADTSDYPLYDLEVEGMQTGSQARVGLRNTWQTKRGGEGRWYSVDVLRIDTDVVFGGSETQGDVEIPRFIDYRPELSRLGDHFFGDLAWSVSDSLSIAGNLIYDLNESAVARSAIGYRIEHTDALYSFADLRYFDAGDEALLGVGLGYRLTPLYRMRGAVTWDLDEDESRHAYVSLARRTPQFDIILGVSYNQIREETSLMLHFAPKGSQRTFGGVLNPRDDGG